MNNKDTEANMKDTENSVKDTEANMQDFNILSEGAIGKYLDSRVHMEYNDREENRRRSIRIVLVYVIINTIVLYFLAMEKYADSIILKALLLSGLIVEAVYLVSSQINLARCQETRQFIMNQKSGFTGKVLLGRVVKLGMYTALVESDYDGSYTTVDINCRPCNTKIKVGGDIVYTHIRNRNGDELNLSMEGEIVYLNDNETGVEQDEN